jgi:hypoxanthine-DNA glycosylase
MKTRLKGLPQILDQATKVLILGSFPSVLSLQKKEYYANPRNYFWKIISEIVGEQFPTNYKHKIALLKKYKIGLWDVVAFCYRDSALDSMIKEPALNDFYRLLKKYPNIKAVFLVGRKAHSLFEKSYSSFIVPYKYLPSTSPANARHPLRLKISQWKKLLNYL